MIDSIVLKLHSQKVREVLFSKRSNKEKAPKIYGNTIEKKKIDWNLNYNSRLHLKLDLFNYCRVLDVVVDLRWLKEDVKEDLNLEASVQNGQSYCENMIP